MSDTIERKIETLSKEIFSGHISSAEYVVRDLSAWQQLWDKTEGICSPQPELPEVDFDCDMVLGVYLGQQTSGGCDIEIYNVVERKNRVEVYVNRTFPEMGMTSTAFTQPYHLVKTPRIDKEVVFVR